MDLTDDQLSDIADDLGVETAALQSDAVKDCAESVKADNPDLSESQAFAICHDMDNQGLLEDPTHVTLAELQDPGAIERVEENGSVRYASLLLLAPGIWGDAGSGRHILYSPEGIANSADNWEDNTVNLFHERENEVTDVGEVDTESIFLGDDSGGLYGDVVLHMDNAASEFADEALQNALETQGREGLQGPSVELRGEEYRWNDDEGVHELVEGTFNGLGLVGLGVSPGPGSKDAAFAEQTRDRAVALAAATDAAVLTPQTHETMKPEELRERLADADIQLGADTDEETLRELAAALDIELQDDEDDDPEDDPDEEEGEDTDPDDADDDDADDDEDDVDINLEEVASRVDEIGSQVAENAERIDAMAERFEDLDDGANLSDLFDTVSDMTETLETLADAESVEELEQRLSDLEDETEAATSLADVDGAEPDDSDEDRVLVEMGPNATHKPRVSKENY